MFDNIKKFVLPDSVLTAIRDAVIDRLAERLDGRNRELVLKFHSDGKFRNELSAALERAVYRFGEEYEDQSLIDAILRNTEFWSIKSVQEAVERIVIRPSSYLESEFVTLRRTFAEVAPTVKPERIDAAVKVFLHCVSEEVMNISQLAPIYQVQLQKISVQQGREMIKVLKDANDLQRKGLLALLEVLAQQKSILIETTGLSQPDEDNLNELKVKYFESVLQKFEYMDMGGISPRVTSRAESRIVSVRMEDVFIPLKCKAEVPIGGYIRQGILVFDKEISEEPEVDVINPIEVPQTYTRDLNHRKNEQIGIASILENRKVVVLGHPGAGKTTIGKYIAYLISAQGNLDMIGEHLRHYIPLLVKAAEYGKFLKNDDSLSFYSYLTGKIYSDEYGPLFTWALKHRQCLVVIDGLDEVPDATLRVRVTTKIEQFVSDYWESRFLVTSRIVGYKGNQLTGDFAHFTLSELDKEQIIEFLKNWYIAVVGKKSHAIEKECQLRSQELWKSIAVNEGVKKLAGTPLLLTIIALVNYYGSRLPDRRVELYQLATETLLSNWPLKQRQQKIEWKEILSILEPIAFHIFTNSQDRLITEYEFRPLFEQQVCNIWGTDARRTRIVSNQLLEKIELHTGFFLKRGTNEQGQEVYGFLHPTFGEYLTARHLAQRWVEKDQLEFAGFIHESSWHEVVLLMAGHLGTLLDVLATRLVEKIENLESPYERYLHRDLMLVAEIIGDNVPVSREKREEIITRLISLALDISYLPLFMHLSELLADISRAFPFINHPKQLILHQDDSISLRVRKVFLLRKIGVFKHHRGMDTMIEGLFADNQLREIAILALNPYLFDLDSNMNRDNIRHILLIPERWQYYRLPNQILEQLSKLQLPFQNLNTLRNGTLISGENDVKQVWLFDLQQIFQLSALELASLFPTDNFGNNWDTGYMLIKFMLLSSSFLIIFEKWLSALISTAQNEDHQGVVNALVAFIDVGDENPLKRTGANKSISDWREPLQSFLSRCNEPKTRIIILNLLTVLFQGKEDLRDIVIQGLSDPEEKVREAFAVKARYYRFGKSTKLIQNKLWELITEPSSNVRLASATTIIRNGLFKEEELPKLLSAAFSAPWKTSDNRLQFIRFRDLMTLANKASTPQSFKLILDEVEKFVNEIQYNEDLGNILMHLFIRDENRKFMNELIKYLISFLKSEVITVRLNALFVFRIMRHSIRSTSFLSQMINASQILPLLNDSDSLVKRTAIRCLVTKDMESLDVMEALYKALQSDDVRVRKVSMAILRQTEVDNLNIINKLLDILKGNDLEEVKEAALTLIKVKNVELRQRVVMEAEQLISNPLHNKYGFDILWNLLVTTEVSSNTNEWLFP